MRGKNRRIWRMTLLAALLLAGCFLCARAEDWPQKQPVHAAWTAEGRTGQTAFPAFRTPEPSAAPEPSFTPEPSIAPEPSFTSESSPSPAPTEPPAPAPTLTPTPTPAPPEENAGDEKAAAVPAEDGVLTLSPPNGERMLFAGEKLQFTARFASHQAGNPAAGSHQVLFSLWTAEGKEVDASEAVVTDKGVLLVKNRLNRELRVTVRAESVFSGARAEYALTLFPAVRQIAVNPGHPIVYLGRDPLTVRAATKPDNLGRAVSWRVGDESVVRLERKEDGSILLYPLREGVTTLSARVRDVSVRVNVTVSQPVTGIRIEGKVFVRKGGYLDLTAQLLPSGVGAQEVEWKLDVDASVATISAKGRLRPADSCPVGTVIYVTCTPKGADGSVSATKKIVVSYAKPHMDK